MRLMVLTLVTLTSELVFAAPGRASRPRRYAIGEVIFDGEVAPEDRRKLEANLWPTVALLVGDYGELVDSEEVRKLLSEHSELSGGRCRDDRCGLKLGDLLKVNRLLTVKIERASEPGGWKWTAQILNFAVDAAEVVGSTVVSCVQCSADDLLRDFSNSFGPVFTNDPSKPLCRLSVASLPPGGTVSVDTIELAEAPFEHTIAAGRHTIVVQHERFAKGQAEIDCKPGAGMDITFTLDEKQSTAATRDLPATISPDTTIPSNSLRVAGGVLIGVGIAGIIAGATLVGINGDPTCDLASGQARCPERYKTGLGGGLILGSGLLAVAGGVVSLVIDARRRH